MAEAQTATAGVPELTWQEKYEKANTFKQEGTEGYKAKKYNVAISKYHRALLYYKGIESGQKFLPYSQGALDASLSSGKVKVPEEDLKTVAKLKCDCYNNLSACLLKVEDPSYAKIEQYSDNVLLVLPSNQKALYRKGVAMFHLNNAEGALDVFNKAARQPGGDNDPLIKKYQVMCQEELAKQETQAKNTYKAMFNPGGQEDSAD